MAVRGDWQNRPHLRQAVVGVLVVASTVTADLASFVGGLGDSRLLLFTCAGLLAAGVTLLPVGADSKKKKPNAAICTASCTA